MLLPVHREARPRPLVLVVEDDQANRILLQAQLERSGFDAVATADGLDGLAAVREVHPDVVLLDVGLPGIDGLEVCRRLRQDPETIALPVILLTGRSSIDDIVEGLDAGADDFLSKPYDEAVLLARLRSATRLGPVMAEMQDAHGVVAALANAVEAKDATTERHCQRLAGLAYDLAIAAGLDAATVKGVTFGALLHMTYHTLAKPVAFFSAGTLAQLHRSSDFDDIGSGTMGRTPVASAVFVLAAVMMTGSPPFGMFFSEMTILRAGFLGPHVVAVPFFLACLVLLFCGFFYQVGRLVLGAQPMAARAGPDPERFDLGGAVMILAAVLAVGSAFYLPQGLLDLIQAAARVVEPGR